MNSFLNPFVYWAQNEKNIFLKVELSDSKDVEVDFEENSLDFCCQGNGAHGNNKYCFHLDFYDKLKKNETKYKITDKNITFIITKKKNEFWPRLISQPQKPQWLKIDFDRWQSPDDMSDNEKVGDIFENNRDIFGRLQKEEIGYTKEDAKKVYLTLYNLFMFLGFFYIWVVMIVKFLKDGRDFFPNTFDHVGTAFYIVQAIQFMEIVHPMLGLMKGGVLMPFLQIIGRGFVLFLMIGQEPKVQRETVVFVLFLAWSSIECIRYPYYMSQIFKQNNTVLTWMRYSAWIILYPVGIVSEFIINYKNLEIAVATGKWSIEMPNSLNFTFSLVYFMRFYLLVLTVPVSVVLLKHMYRARQKKFGGRRLKKSS